MRVVRLDIDGFRGIKKGTIVFDNHTVLVGPNGCGKSTVMDALALVLGRDRIVRPLTEHDFYGSNPEPTQRIHLVATIAGFDGDDPSLYQNWFRDGRAVPKWWDVDQREIKVQKDKPNDQLCFQIAFSARFDRASLSVETIRYFLDSESPVDPFVDEAVTQVPGRLLSELGFYLVAPDKVLGKTPW